MQSSIRVQAVHVEHEAQLGGRCGAAVSSVWCAGDEPSGHQRGIAMGMENARGLQVATVPHDIRKSSVSHGDGAPCGMSLIVYI